MTPSYEVAQDWETGGADVIDLDDIGSATGPMATDSVTYWGTKPEAPELLTKAEYLTKAQAGEIVQLHPKTIERAIMAGELSAFKLRGKVRIRRSDLEEWVVANAVEPSPGLHDF